MEPKLKAPRVVYPDKDRLLALARPKPTTSWRIWAGWGSAAAAVGGVLALLTPTAEVGKMPPLALVVPQVKEVAIDTVQTPVAIEVKKQVPKVVSVPKTPQVPIEGAPETPKEKPWTVRITKPSSVRIAYTPPQPILIEPILHHELETEPSLWDQLTEPFRVKPERPEPKQLIASITFTNPFKTTDDESF